MKYPTVAMSFVFAGVLMSGVLTNMSEYYDHKTEIISKAINGVPLSAESEQGMYKMNGGQNLY